MPTSRHSVDKIWDNVMWLATHIPDESLRRVATSCFESLEDQWKSTPAAKAVHHNYIAGVLIHSFEVATIAFNLCIDEPILHLVKQDLVVAGALLHDIGKLFSYKFDGAVIEMTTEGQLFEHSFIGANFIDNFAESLFPAIDKRTEHKLRLLKHIILSHHGKQEYGAAVPPRCLEAHIVHLADGLSATAEQYRVASAALQNDGVLWTDKIWALDNRPHVSTRYINKLFAEPDADVDAAQ